MDSREKYLKLCKECDYILEKTKINQICKKCSTEKPYNNNSKFGCCSGCKYLSEEGCKTQSLTCKLWFCSENIRKLILNSKFKNRWIEIESIVTNKKKSMQHFGIDINKPRATVDELFP